MRLNILILWKIFLLQEFTLALQNIFINSRNQQHEPLTPLPDIRYYQPLQPTQNLTVAAATPLAPLPTKNPFFKFSSKLFRLINPTFSRTNLIYSPLSLQIILSFIYIGAENQTAQELQKVLEISELPAQVARQIQTILEQMKLSQLTAASDLQLQMANKIYYTTKLQLNKEFYKNTIPYFNAEAESTDFTRPEEAAYQINKWAADRTNQRILNLIPPGTLDPNTKAILVNAIYLKAKWRKPFSTLDTQRSNFQMSNELSVPVDMMFNEDTYDFSDLPALNAKAINLPFKNSDLSMMILLPNDVNGLAILEAEFTKVDFNSLINVLRTETVILRLPKFRIDFDIDMSETLKRLGLIRLFSEQAQLSGFFKNQTVRLSKVQQKAYINVNEGGVEAAAATFSKLVPLSAPTKINYFNVDHPFMFLIHSQEAVYFIGHVINP